MHLQQPPSSPARRRTGRILLATLAGVTAFVALAARAGIEATPAAVPIAVPTAVPTAVPNYAVAMTVRIGEGSAPHTFRVLTPGNFSVRMGEGAGAWTGEFSMSSTGPEQLSIHSKISQNGKLVSEPAVLTRLGTSSAIRISGAGGAPGLALDMTVTQEGRAAPGA